MTQLAGSNILVILTMFVGATNLITPFISKEDSSTRSFFLVATSIFFLCNILMLDYLFLSGIEPNFTIISFGKYSIALALESLGMIFLNLLAFLWIIALLYTIKFLAINGMKDSSRFLFFLNCCILSGILIALSGNLLTMFVFYEILTLFTVPLIAHSSDKKSTQGLFKYLKILMISALVLLLPFVIIIYSTTGSGDFIPGGFIEGHFKDSYAIILLLMMIFGTAKSALFPLHGWLPAAMVASYPVSALLHAVVVVKTGLFCTYKIIVYVFGIAYLQTLFANYNWLVLLPIITIIYSSFQVLRFNEIKMILAYSTINQLSIALLSAFLLSPKGLIAAVLHMVSHAFSKICMFYAAGNIYSVKNSYNLNQLIGIKNTMPKTSFVMLISGLSLIGIPPFAGFISKFYILLAAAEQDNFLVIITLLISSIFTALYVLKMLIFIYLPTSNNSILHLKLKPYFAELADDGSEKRVISSNYKAEKKLPPLMIISISLCLCGVVWFFFIKQIIVKFLGFM
jgi:multicomponent Na+:H+ antiporter subunit D